MDYDTPANNQFLLVNQFSITGTSNNRRPDL